MDFNPGKPDHIEDYLITYRPGQWFGWSDVHNKVYENLIVLDGGDKPTEQECVDGLKALEENYNVTHAEYRVKRGNEYPGMFDQLSMIYDDIANGKLNKTGSFYKTIKAIKDKYPKS